MPRNAHTPNQLLQDDERIRRELLGLDEPGYFSSPPPQARPAAEVEVAPEATAEPYPGDDSPPVTPEPDRDRRAALDAVTLDLLHFKHAPKSGSGHVDPTSAAIPDVDQGVAKYERYERNRERRSRNTDRMLQAIYAAGTGTKLPDSFWQTDKEPDPLDQEYRRERVASERLRQQSMRGAMTDASERRRMAAEAVLAKRARHDPDSPESAQVRSAAIDTIAVTAPELLEKYRPVIEKSSASWIEDKILPGMTAETKKIYGDSLAEKRMAHSDEQAELNRKERAQARLESRLVGQARAAEREASATKRAADKTEHAALGGTVGYRDGEFAPREGYGPPETGVKNDFVKTTAASAAVQDQLEAIKRDLQELAANPTGRIASAVRSRIQSRQGLIAPKINVALGQGAMAQNEYERVKESIGDISSRDFWFDALTRAASDPNEAGLLASRIETAQSFFDSSVRNYANTLNLEYRPRRKSQPSKSSNTAPAKVRVRNSRGETLLIDPSDAAEAARDGYKAVE